MLVRLYIISVCTYFNYTSKCYVSVQLYYKTNHSNLLLLYFSACILYLSHICLCFFLKKKTQGHWIYFNYHLHHELKSISSSFIYLRKIYNTLDYFLNEQFGFILPYLSKCNIDSLTEWISFTKKKKK